MKKKLGVLIAICLIVTVAGVGITKLCHNGEKEEKKKITIVTSFYPMYIVAANIAKSIPEVQVVNLTEIKGGCLHDYQLTTEDMKKLETADIFLMNGGGMEGFIEEVIKAYPDLNIIDSSENISLLPIESAHVHEEVHEEAHEEGHEEGHEEDHEEGHEESHEHNHGEYNSHIWLSVTNYKKQIENTLKQLIKMDKEHKKSYEKNTLDYLAKIESLELEFKEAKKILSGVEVISFHEGFGYLAEELGMEIVKVLDLDENNGLSAGEMAEVIDEMKYHKIKHVLVEEQYVSFIKEGIGKETKAKVLTVDSMVGGQNELDSYIEGMRSNLAALLQIEKTK